DDVCVQLERSRRRFLRRGLSGGTLYGARSEIFYTIQPPSEPHELMPLPTSDNHGERMLSASATDRALASFMTSDVSAIFVASYARPAQPKRGYFIRDRVDNGNDRCIPDYSVKRLTSSSRCSCNCFGTTPPSESKNVLCSASSFCHSS